MIFIPRTIDLGHFLGHDELMRNNQSLGSFQAIADGRWDDVYSSNFGATNLTWAVTIAKVIQFGWLRLQGRDVSLQDMVNVGPGIDPLPGAIFNGCLLLILLWFMQRLFNWRIAVLATVILALDPYMLSEARILRTEAAYAGFITLTSVCLTLYARTGRRGDLAWSGVWAAWATATKISGLMLFAMVPVVLVGIGLVWQRPAFGQRLKRWVVDVVLWSGVTIVATFVIWPQLWTAPLRTLVELWQFVNFWGLQENSDLPLFFQGHVVQDLPPLYYILVILYKTTPLVWLGVVAFFGALWLGRQPHRSDGEPTWAGLSFPLAGGVIIGLMVLMYAVIMSLARFKTERYMMAAASNLNVVAAVGLYAFAYYVYRRWRPQRSLQPVLWAGGLGLFVLGHGLFTWLNHPYYFSYYNPLLSAGLGRPAQVLAIGSGEGLDLAIAYLNQKPKAEDLVVVCGTNFPRCEYLSHRLKLLKQNSLNAVHADWISADYVVTYIFQAQRGDYPPGVVAYLQKRGPEYTANFQGIDYAHVYPAPAAQYVAASQLTGISTLLGYSLDKQTVSGGDKLHLKLYLENDGKIEYDMFVQLTDPDGYLWNETMATLTPGFESLTEEVGAIIEGEATLSIPPGLPSGLYYLRMGYRKPNGEQIGEFDLPSNGDRIVGNLATQFVPAAEQPSYLLDLAVDESLTLVGYDLQPVPQKVETEAWLTLFWQAKADVQHDYVINLRLLDEQGNEIAYWLGRPARSSLPTNQWRAGQFVQDPWRLAMPADVEVGSKQIEIAIYDAETKQEVKRQILHSIHQVSSGL